MYKVISTSAFFTLILCFGLCQMPSLAGKKVMAFDWHNEHGKWS